MFQVKAEMHKNLGYFLNAWICREIRFRFAITLEFDLDSIDISRDSLNNLLFSLFFFLLLCRRRIKQNIVYT